MREIAAFIIGIGVIVGGAAVLDKAVFPNRGQQEVSPDSKTTIVAQK
jgi:hypothetical protein